MLDVLESFVQKRDYSYIRMDGATAIASRQPLVARFNTVSILSLFIQFMFTVMLGVFAPRRIGLSHCALSPSPSSSLLSHFVVITPVSMRPLGLPTVRLDSRRCHVTPVDIAG